MGRGEEVWREDRDGKEEALWTGKGWDRPDMVWTDRSRQEDGAVGVACVWRFRRRRWGGQNTASSWARIRRPSTQRGSPSGRRFSLWSRRARAVAPILFSRTRHPPSRESGTTPGARGNASASQPSISKHDLQPPAMRSQSAGRRLMLARRGTRWSVDTQWTPPPAI